MVTKKKEEEKEEPKQPKVIEDEKQEAAARKEAKKQESPSFSLDSLIKEADKRIASDKHAMLVVPWVTIRDAALSLIENEKRYNLLYVDGRTSEGKGADKNLPRKTEERVEVHDG